jgi:hypothetical protein
MGPSGAGATPLYWAGLSSLQPPGGGRATQSLDAYSNADPGALGGGVVFWNSTDTRSPDGGTIAQVTSPSTINPGRWNRQLGTYVSLAQFGVFPSGSDQTAGIATADAAAFALGLPLQIDAGSYVLGTLTFKSRIRPMPGAVLAPTGTITFNRAPDVGKRQQFLAPSSSVVFAPNTVEEIWCEWFGATPDSTLTIDSTSSIQSAINAQKTASAVVTQGAGNGPLLRIGPGLFKISNPVNGSPSLLLDTIKGGEWRGAGRGQTVLYHAFTTGHVSVPAIVRKRNCQEYTIRGIDQYPQSGLGMALQANAPAGSTTLSLSSNAPFGFTGAAASPIAMTLSAFLNYAETVYVTNVSADGHTVTLAQPTQQPFRPFDWSDGVTSSGVICELVYAPDVGYQDYQDGTSDASHHNSTIDCSVGNDAIYAIQTGFGIDCNGGAGSASDIQNDKHSFYRCRVVWPVRSSVRVGHTNAIGEQFQNCVLCDGHGLYGFEVRSGGSFTERDCDVSADVAAYLLGGFMSHDIETYGTKFEQEIANFILADHYVAKDTYTTASFTQPPADGTTTVTVNVASTANWLGRSYFISISGGGYYQVTSSTGSSITIKRLNASSTPPGTQYDAATGATIGAGATVGNCLESLSFQQNQPSILSGALVRSLNSSAAAGQKVLNVLNVKGFRVGQRVAISGPGAVPHEYGIVADVRPSTIAANSSIVLQANLVNSYTSSGFVTPVYFEDVAGFQNKKSTFGGNWAGGQTNVPGNEIRWVDVGGSAASEVAYDDTVLGFCGWNLDAAVLRLDAMVTTSPVAGLLETYANGGDIYQKDGHQFSASGYSTLRAMGVVRGLRRIYGSPARPTNLTIDPQQQIHVLMATARATNANSPYLADPDIEVVVDCSGGNVAVQSTVALLKGEFLQVSRDTSTTVSGHSITVSAAAGQTLEVPSTPGTFASSVTFSGSSATAVNYRWKNKGSASGQLLVEQSAGSSSGFALIEKTASYTLDSGGSLDQEIWFDTSGGGTINLQLSSPIQRFFYVYDKKGTFGTTPVNMLQFGSEKIANVAGTKQLNANYGMYRVSCNGTEWAVRGS